MLAAALVAWLVALLGDRVVKGVSQSVLGPPEQRALIVAADVAIDSIIQDFPEQSRSSLDEVLHDRFAEPPAMVLDGRTRVRTGLIRAIQVQIAPLADPTITLTGKSYFEEIGIDAAQIRDDLAEVMIRAIEQVAPAFPALTPLIVQLNADSLQENLDTVRQGVDIVLKKLEETYRESRGSVPRPANDSQGLARSYIEERLVNALLSVPTIADDASRSEILNMLPSQLLGAIPRNSRPRLQVLAMVRTCLNYENGISDLIHIIHLTEGDSVPMRKLDKMILELSDE